MQVEYKQNKAFAMIAIILDIIYSYPSENSNIKNQYTNSIGIGSVFWLTGILVLVLYRYW